MNYSSFFMHNLRIINQQIVKLGIMIPCAKCDWVLLLQKNLAMKTEIQFRNSIGCVLLSKRQALAVDGIKVTQEDVAFEAGISTRYYGKIERGETMPTLYTLMKIAPVLQLSLGELCKQIEEF